MVSRTRLVSVALGALLALGFAGTARAQDWHRGCDRRIRQERKELRRAIRRFGFYSRQAREERAEYRWALARCGEGRWNRDWDRDEGWWGWHRGRDGDEGWWRGGGGEQERDDHGRERHRGWWWHRGRDREGDHED